MGALIIFISTNLAAVCVPVQRTAESLVISPSRRERNKMMNVLDDIMLDLSRRAQFGFMLDPFLTEPQNISGEFSPC